VDNGDDKDVVSKNRTFIMRAKRKERKKLLVDVSGMTKIEELEKFRVDFPDVKAIECN
jgi:hypothetical protein